MHFNFLEDVNIIDFTARLPGPFSTMVLASLGATITKIENTDIGCDPFTQKDYVEHAPHFEDWYKKINEDKNILKISFSKDLDKITKLALKADIIFVPENRYFDEFLRKIDFKKTVVIKLSGGKGEWKSLHDLNALALTQSFNEHVKDSAHPPYLPLAGLSFAQYLATAALAAMRKADKTNSSIEQTLYLKDVSIFILDSLHSNKSGSEGRFLHNGEFPCYQIYKSRDAKALCLAAVELKYWENLQKAFKVVLRPQDRFDTSGKTQIFLKNMFAKYNSDEIREKINNIHACLTIAQGNKD